MADVVQTTLDDVTLAQAALAATREVPGVVDINRGRYAVARTFGLGGRVVEGLQLRPELEGLHVEVHVVVQPVPLPALAEAVRAAIATTLRGLGARVTVVDVWVDDLRRPEEEALL
jgi:uncharacterized alkaline shock family protein YloU